MLETLKTNNFCIVYKRVKWFHSCKADLLMSKLRLLTTLESVTAESTMNHLSGKGQTDKRRCLFFANLVMYHMPLWKKPFFWNMKSKVCSAEKDNKFIHPPLLPLLHVKWSIAVRKPKDLNGTNMRILLNDIFIRCFSSRK